MVDKKSSACYGHFVSLIRHIRSVEELRNTEDITAHMCIVHKDADACKYLKPVKSILIKEEKDTLTKLNKAYFCK